MFNKIKHFFKSLLAKRTDDDNVVYYINNSSITYINWDLIKELNPYDIIYVKMTDQCLASATKAITTNHQTRPFLIESINNDNLTIDGYYTTSNTNCCRFLPPSKKRYKLFLTVQLNNPDKKSLVLIDRKITLPYQNVIKKIRSTDAKEINLFKKIVSTYNKQNIISTKENPIIDVGDIVFNENKNYYIYQKDNTHSYGYNIVFMKKYLDNSSNKALIKNPNHLLIHPNIYQLNYTLRKQFSNKDELTINDISTTETIYEVIDKQKQFKKNQKMRR